MADDETTKHEKPMGPVGSLIMALVFGGAGIAMAMNLLGGKAEFVHGPRTSHWLVSLLGENCFLGVSCVVCLLLGAAGLITGIAELVKGPRAEAEAEQAPRSSSTIEVTCPSCAKTSRVPAKAAGRRRRCPGCKTEFRA